MGVSSSQKLVHLAKDGKEREVLKLLQETYLIDPTYTNDKGETALYFACANNLRALCKQLLTYSPNLNQRLHGTAPLHIATRMGHDHIVSLLLKEATCDINLETRVKTNALTIAAACNNLQIAHLLLNQDKQCKVQDQALLYAAIHNEGNEMCRVLLNHGCNINGTDENGNTALMQSAALCNEKVVTVLLSREWTPSIDINAQNKWGWTALHFAYAASPKQRRIEKANIITMLLNKNANLQLNNNEGKKPSQMVCEDNLSEGGRMIEQPPPRKKRRMDSHHNRHADHDHHDQSEKHEMDETESKDEHENASETEKDDENPYDNYSPPLPRNKKRARGRVNARKCK
mmetsp:Transcript_3982/g.6753  ORF Transcript_3982/g.6753 Transcript_3982/m.6753 type:complete len:345 (+) Transcript_3982:54-1088(+)